MRTERNYSPTAVDDKAEKTDDDELKLKRKLKHWKAMENRSCETAMDEHSNDDTDKTKTPKQHEAQIKRQS